MTREWQPGDVALVIRPGAPARSGHPAIFTEDHGWCCCSVGPNCDGEPVHPLVVIDPEDREQVERLAHAFQRTAGPDIYDDMQAALREFADPKPPKPEEPTGLYARIEDVTGRVWVRTATQASVWRRESVNSEGFRYLIPDDGCVGYDQIDVVRVLSDGWAGEDA